MKEDFYHFKRNSTMDAYFKKYTDVIMRTGRKEKDYLKELVQTVDNFLDDSAVANVNAAEERKKSMFTKEVEPSGADTLLVQLSLQNQKEDIPTTSENMIA